MSGSVSAASPTDYGLISGIVSDGAAIRQQLDKLTNQAGDGLVADTYAGLGSRASVSLDLNPEIASMQTWQNNINSVTGSVDVTQTTMTQIQGIASNLYSQLYGLQGTDGSEVSTIAASARNALTEVANLLDATNGNTYVFSGADSTNPPVPGPDNILSTGFYTQIAAAVGNLGSAGASATAAATLAIASSNAAGTSPFSSYVSQPAATLQAQMPQVQTGEGQTVSVGLLASANTSVASTGSSTTGSYMRDLLRALATVGSLTSAQQSDPGFQGLVEDTMSSLNGAISAMAEDTGVLGNTQSALSTTQTTLADTQTALTAQVSSVQDVNMASTLSKLSLVETQLQASYQVIATVSQLSLVKFLPAA
jgi:flagellar hook-associated protein 3 FlgL